MRSLSHGDVSMMVSETSVNNHIYIRAFGQFNALYTILHVWYCTSFGKV